MSSALFDTIRLLERARLHFFIERTRPDLIRLNVTMVGERLEIDVFEDDPWKSRAFMAMRALKAEGNCWCAC